MTVHATFAPAVQMLPDGRRLHLQHGPIDLIVSADGRSRDIVQAYRLAARAFETVLQDLVDELAHLRRPIDRHGQPPGGPVAKRMVVATRKHVGQFLTPMASVAGAVADHVLASMLACDGLARAYVNNGGDIALYLAEGQTFTIGVVADPQTGRRVGTIEISAASRVRGVATSGWRGRSHSFGIADAVTVLASNGADADAAATLIANAVDLPDHGGIARTPACELSPESDLGRRLVTIDVPDLTSTEVAEALEAGARCANDMCRSGLIHAAFLCCQGDVRCVQDSNQNLVLSNNSGGKYADA